MTYKSNRNSNQKPVSQPVDWQDIHRRVDALRQAIDSDWQVDEKSAEKIFRQRAVELAGLYAVDDSHENDIEILEFSLADARYGIAATFVREVCPLTNIVPIPCSPSFVMGIVNVRNEFVSVIDIRNFFGFSHNGLNDLGKVIILQNDVMTFGILVDLIVGTRHIDSSFIQPAARISGIDTGYLSGMTAEGMVLLDAEKLLSDSGIIVNEEI